MPLRFQVAAFDRLAKLALRDQGVAPKGRMVSTQLTKPNRFGQAERCVVASPGSNPTFLESSSDYYVIFGHGGILLLEGDIRNGFPGASVNRTSPKPPGRTPCGQGKLNDVEGMVLNGETVPGRVPP